MCNIPLLSIAIPTWNRANILKICLSKLLPQILKHRDYIEFIVSDNGSTDDSIEVINSFKESYSSICFTTNQNKINTGYFGNFKKCRELATGKYLWLLSDNDHVTDGILDQIIICLQQSETLGGVFLKYSSQDGMANKKFLVSEILDFNKLIEQANRHITLLSTNIFLNTKDEDDKIFHNFLGNSFLGFILVIQAYSKVNKAIIISGPSLVIFPATVSFNIFESFTSHIFCTFLMMNEKNLVTKIALSQFKEDIIYNIIKDHYLNLKIYGMLQGRKYNLREVEATLISYYGDVEAFVEILLPLFRTSRHMLLARKYFKKITKKIGNIFHWY
jgi:glycosyltransferase involved in cell wall biosynthesis